MAVSSRHSRAPCRHDSAGLDCATGSTMTIPFPPAMFSRPFYPDRFLRSVGGTKPFRDYCRLRRIRFERNRAPPSHDRERQRWADALAELPPAQQARVEWELATVNEMAG